MDDSGDDGSSPLFTPSPSPSREGHDGGVQPARRFVDTLDPISPIAGLYYCPGILTKDESFDVVEQVMQSGYFDVGQGRDQAVLFGSPVDGEALLSHDTGQAQHPTLIGLPDWCAKLIGLLEERLRANPLIPSDTLDIVFGSGAAAAADADADVVRARQLILNTYSPGQGIASHIDLPHRFLDGIMILSFGTAIAMDFFRQPCPPGQDDTPSLVADDDRLAVYLEPRSLCILTKESRWQWTHGIAARTFDIVQEVAQDETISVPHRSDRGLRLSITIRWLKVQNEDDMDDHPQSLSQSFLRH